MKKIFVLVVLAGCVLSSSAQDGGKAVSGAIITWEKATYDFGEIFQGDKVEHTFSFTNAGDQDLLITNVQVSCGCTTPKGWPRDPIPPGQGGDLSVAFNSAGKMGKQNKVITITSNSSGTLNQVTFSVIVLEKKQPDR